MLIYEMLWLPALQLLFDTLPTKRFCEEFYDLLLFRDGGDAAESWRTWLVKDQGVRIDRR